MSEISVLRRYYWSLKREIWENPAIWVAPVAAGALALFAYIISAVRPGGHGMVVQALLAKPYDFASGLVMISTMIVGVFYCLDTLYGERRDRSILFWKSLPVSDATTVAAKLTIPFIILPLLASLITTIVLLLMIVVGGAGLPPLWRTSELMAYHMFTVHSLWWAPFFGWLVLISAWARRAPLVWAIVPIAALSFFERIAFNTTYVAGVLLARFNFSPEAIVAKGTMPVDPLTHLTPGAFLLSPGLWIGLAIAFVLAIVAVRLRRANGPI